MVILLTTVGIVSLSFLQSPISLSKSGIIESKVQSLVAYNDLEEREEEQVSSSLYFVNSITKGSLITSAERISAYGTFSFTHFSLNPHYTNLPPPIA